MTRRPKLSLSANNTVDKKQPPGFDTAIEHEQPRPTLSAATSRSTPQARPETVRTSDPTTAIADAPPRSTDRPSSRQVIKVILVVVAAALSLYLLKRRLR